MACSVEKTLPVAWLDEKNSPYHSAMAEVRTCDLRHKMNIAMGK